MLRYLVRFEIARLLFTPTGMLACIALLAVAGMAVADAVSWVDGHRLTTLAALAAAFYLRRGLRRLTA